MRDGRWAVARVVEARRTKTGGFLALVEWKGVDPVSGVAWENSSGSVCVTCRSRLVPKRRHCCLREHDERAGKMWPPRGLETG
jgi:hypothetical protein